MVQTILGLLLLSPVKGFTKGSVYLKQFAETVTNNFPLLSGLAVRFLLNVQSSFIEVVCRVVFLHLLSIIFRFHIYLQILH